MAEDHHEPRPELAGGELDASDLRRCHDVAGDTDDEQVAQALIEHDLGGDARVRAPEDNRERLLSIGQIAAMRTPHDRRMTANVGHESLVAFAQPIECFCCGEHRR